ncbi:MAG TPA: exodeoxyribonuclease III [Ilumatobacter sp.]|nr:exodeoxyribonuclease III [Ilumatobacter sp.]
MRIVTWNINSLRVRQERVEEWVAEVQPDVLCLQETKLADDAFPGLPFSALGYESVHYGQGQWNGVAILSKVGIENVVTNFSAGIEPDPDARLISATCGGVRISNCYVPNGRALDDPHYTYKLSWLERLQQHITAESQPSDDVVVTGDFNIAPTDVDVYDPAKLVGATHASKPERDHLDAIKAWGLTDLFRQQHPDAKSVYSWWDYRAGDFHMGRGMRIDLVLGSASVSKRLAWSTIDRNARKGKQPSDHAPVIVDLG